MSAESPPGAESVGGYYADKRATLERLFGTRDLSISFDALRVGNARYPIERDVIQLACGGEGVPAGGAIATDIRETFGNEWQTYPEILPEHEVEFRQYFDLVPMESLNGKRVADLGCGTGRWSWFLRERCSELVLVDFSEAIFVARRNLADCPHALFFQADVERLPFADDSFDLIFALGVLHHLPTPALAATRRLARLAPRFLVFLYHGLDNRPLYYRILLALVTAARGVLWRVRFEPFRRTFSWLGAIFLYRPLVALGQLAEKFGAGRMVPLYEFYRGHSVRRLRQDVYDRFFTRIEQRVTRKQIRELSDTFSEIHISGGVPYWHFLGVRER